MINHVQSQKDKRGNNSLYLHLLPAHVIKKSRSFDLYKKEFDLPTASFLNETESLLNKQYLLLLLIEEW